MCIWKAARASARRARSTPGVALVNATLGDRVTIRNYCVITDSTVESDVRLGPFAHLRPGSVVQRGGPRRQLRRAEEDDARRRIEGEPPHVSGRRHHRREREHRRRHDHLQLRRQAQAPDRSSSDGAFIGSDSQLIAPVTVGKGAYVAAGSSIVEDVPDEALGIARGRQVNKEGWVRAKEDGASVAGSPAEPGPDPASQQGGTDAQA